MFKNLPGNISVDASEQLRFNEQMPEHRKLLSLFYSEKPIKWLFAGDSITHGCLHTKEYPRFSEIFEFYLGANPLRRKDCVFNTAVSGATTQDCLKYENEWLYSLKSDIAFICFGMNDANREEVTESMFRNNLLRFINELRQRGAIPILQTPQLSERWKFTDPYNEIIRQIASEEKVMLIDLDKYWKCHRSDVKGMMNDPVHPNRYGHLQWMRMIVKAIGLPEVSKVFSIPYGKLKGKDKPFVKTGKSVFTAPEIIKLLEEKRVTNWLIIGDFDTDCSFPKRTVPEHFEEIIRFRMANEDSTSLMRFCSHIDTSRVSCREILDNYDFYIGSYKWDAVIFYPFEDVDKLNLRERIVNDVPFTVQAD